MDDSPAGARSRLYSLLSGAFSFPTEVFFEAANDGVLARQLEDAAAALASPIALAAGLLRPAAGTYAEFQADYIASFEVGAAGPPCPLYAGVYLGGRNQVWEELIRFYNLFGLHLSPENRDLPDHISTELEFMHFLAWKELASDSPKAAASMRTAQRDFIERQLLRWIGLLAKRAEKKSAPAFYRALIDLTCEFVGMDLSALRDSGHLALANTGAGVNR